MPQPLCSSALQSTGALTAARNIHSSVPAVITRPRLLTEQVCPRLSQPASLQLRDWPSGANGRPPGLVACLPCSARPSAAHADLLLVQGADEGVVPTMLPLFTRSPTFN